MTMSSGMKGAKMDALVQWDMPSDPEGDLVGFVVYHAYGMNDNWAIPGGLF
jgi:hypothetical protein